MKFRNHVFFLWVAGIALLVSTGCSFRGRRQAVSAPPPPPSPVVPNVAENFPLHRFPSSPPLRTLPEPRFDPVADVIERAEAAFRRGEENYNAGHLGMAKQEFNAALAALLKPPFTPSEDKRLRKAFDSLVDRVHAYEVEALQQGDGFAEPIYQPAPLDELETLTFAEDQQWSEDLQAYATNTMSDLPITVNPQVASFIKYFSSTKRGQATLESALRRSGRFRDMILRILDEEGVPLDLLYLAQAESAFHTRALSRAGAMGLWQFMPSRGKEYGLARDWWVDERLNPEKATRAAARHLKDLYLKFGDWYLAMAAYNAGPGTVQRAVQRTGSSDFWELSKRRVLPGETRNYIPIILALTIIGKNPDKYGLEAVLPDPAWAYDTVEVTHPVDLRLVAEIVGTSVETVQELNPSLRRMTTPNVPEHTLRIPLATKDLFLKRVAMIPAEKRVYWRWHTVRHGDSLWTIARKYRTSVEAIAEVNNLDSKQSLQEAAELVIPVTGGPSNGSVVGQGQYSVGQGDTLSRIASRFNTSVSQLMIWNDLNSTLIRAGSTLIVGESAPELTEADNREPPVNGERYRIRPGDSLSRIAQRFHVSVSQLMAWNNLRNSQIRVGNTLVVQPSSPRSSRSDAPQQASSLRSVSRISQPQGTQVHRVRSGESLWQIATNYGTSVEALKKSNRHLGKILHIGDRVIIPVSK